jgi:diamine N-acetyltransferase
MGTEIIIKDEQALDEVENLWYELMKVQIEDSTYFKEQFQNRKFQDRKQELLTFAKAGKMIVALAYEEAKDPIGYCIANVTLKQIVDTNEIRCIKGEIDSICVANEYRGKGIGKQLITEALHWMEQFCPEKTMISVATGHESVYPFYEQFGFYPRTSILQRK